MKKLSWLVLATGGLILCQGAHSIWTGAIFLLLAAISIYQWSVTKWG